MLLFAHVSKNVYAHHVGKHSITRHAHAHPDKIMVDPGFGLVEIDQQLVLTPITLSPCLPTIIMKLV